MKITFCGYYGMKNYGDDLFTKVINWGNKEFWESEAKFLSPKVKGVDAKFWVNSSFMIALYQNKSIVGKIVRSSINIIAAFSSNYLIMAGGSTIGSLSSNTMMKLHILLAKLKITKFAGIGLSVGPFFNSEDYNNAKKYLSYFEFLYVRDKNSYEIVKEMGCVENLFLANDLVGLLPLVDKDSEIEVDYTEKKKKILGVSLCNFERFNQLPTVDEENRNNFIIDAIKKFKHDTGYSVVIFCLNTHESNGDVELSERLAEELDFDAEIIFFDDNLENTLKKIRECTIFFTIRLHGAITAYLYDIPFSLVEYHEKCTEFLYYINQPNFLKVPRVVEDSIEIEKVLHELAKENTYEIMNKEEYIDLAKLNFNQKLRE